MGIGPNALARAWARWVARLSGRPRQQQDARSELAAGIARTRARRREVTGQVGNAFARLREVEQQLGYQRMQLVRAHTEIVTAVARAERAADAARAEGLATATPYDDTAAALRSQQAVIDAAIGELDAARTGARANVLRSKELLQRSRETLDATLHEQVTLLARLDALQRQIPPDAG